MTHSSCTRIQANLVAYLDGELERGDHARVEAHLQVCPTCAAERRALDGVWEALDGLDGLSAPSDLVARVEARVRLCADVQDDLVAYLDGELVRARRGEVAVHLTACAVCAAERQALVATHAALDELEGIEARPGWLDEVEAAIVEPAGELIQIRVWTRYTVAAAAAVLVTLGLAWLLTGDGTGSQERELAPSQPAPRVERERLPDKVVPHNALPEDVAPDAGSSLQRGETGQERRRPELRAPEQRGMKNRELAAADPFEELKKLAPEEREVVKNLEALAMLQEAEDKDVVENIDLLDDLDEDELDES